MIRSAPGPESQATQDRVRQIYPFLMRKALVVADAAWVRNEVHATLTASDWELIDHTDPATAAQAALDADATLVITDLQVGAMGGMAVTRSLRERTGSTDSPGMPVILLLDRSADAFLAKRAGAAAWLTKPFTSGDLEAAVERALGAENDTPAEAGAG